MNQTDKDWEQFASVDPYWAVLTSNRFRNIAGDEGKKGEFYGTGEKHIEYVVGKLRDYFKCDCRFESSLDFGCGVGRLLFPLARLSERAVGVDISRTMLDECATQARRFGIANIELEHAEEEFLGAPSQDVDLITTYIVLQHIPTNKGMFYFRRLLERLRPAGFGYVQIPIAMSLNHLWCESGNTTGVLYKYYQRIGASIVRLCEEPIDSSGIMQMNHYNLNEIYAELTRYGVSQVFSTISNTDGTVSTELFFQMPRVLVSRPEKWGLRRGFSADKVAAEGTFPHGMERITRSLAPSAELTITPAEPLEVSGWALCPGLAPPTAVDVLLDGTVYAAEFGLQRDDVAQHYGTSSAASSGFRFYLPGGCLPTGAHSLSIRVVCEGGECLQSEAIQFFVRP